MSGNPKSRHMAILPLLRKSGCIVENTNHRCSRWEDPRLGGKGRSENRNEMSFPSERKTTSPLPLSLLLHSSWMLATRFLHPRQETGEFSWKTGPKEKTYAYWYLRRSPMKSLPHHPTVKASIQSFNAVQCLTLSTWMNTQGSPDIWESVERGKEKV